MNQTRASFSVSGLSRLFLLLLTLLVPGIACAEPVDYQKRIRPTTLVLDQKDERTGIVGKTVRGTTPRGEGRAVHFVVKGLQIAHPVQVMLIGPEAGKELTLQIHKFNWDDADATLGTGVEQFAAKTFRTEGGVGFKITSAEPGTPYILRVRRGEPMPSVRPSVAFVTGEAAVAMIGPAARAAGADGGGEESSNTVLVAILGVLVIIAVLLGRIAFARRGAAPLIVVGLLGLVWTPTESRAQQAMSDEQLKAEIDKLRDLTGAGARIEAEMAAFEDMVLELAKLEQELEGRYKERDAEGGAATGGAGDKDNKYAAADGGVGSGSGPKPEEGSGTADTSSGRSESSRDVDRLRSRIQELERRVDALTPQDAATIPGADATSRPPLPSLCAGDPRCEACFEEARREIEEVERLFLRLNAIYRSTNDFARIQIRKGDILAAAYPGAVGGANLNALAWEKEKIGIENAVAEMGKAYAAKFNELKERIDVQLRRLGECEQQYGIPDWYARFGALYLIALESQNALP
ncbi:hypothetical protein ASA1KI_12520 [Opitutales bacterium ASA1]|uniref:hypothetical protein n=1 Tax=Congregicoccus parvus TaxID=3081749 RepID=UPI002B2CA20E|nr:hypothetical protein ASA1KI_12520 [Opitutales bacterium ASA1]